MALSIFDRLRPSQTSIARDLGLSQATVSLALAGKRHICGVKSYRRVRAYAIAVGYSSDKTALVSQGKIARDLGLSQPTVSNALAGKREICGAKTFLRVWTRAVELRYRGLTEANPFTSPLASPDHNPRRLAI